MQLWDRLPAPTSPPTSVGGGVLQCCLVIVVAKQCLHGSQQPVAHHKHHVHTRCVTGRVVTVSSTDDALVGSRYIAVAELLPGRDGRNDRVTLGAALSSEAIEAHLQDEIQARAGALVAFLSSACMSLAVVQYVSTDFQRFFVIF